MIHSYRRISSVFIFSSYDDTKQIALLASGTLLVVSAVFGTWSAIIGRMVFSFECAFHCCQLMRNCRGVEEAGERLVVCDFGYSDSLVLLTSSAAVAVAFATYGVYAALNIRAESIRRSVNLSQNIVSLYQRLMQRLQRSRFQLALGESESWDLSSNRRWPLVRAMLRAFTESVPVQICVISLVVLDAATSLWTVLCAKDDAGGDRCANDSLDRALFLAGAVFTHFFILELVLRIIGFGPKQFFRGGLNVFDFLVVMASWILLVIDIVTDDLAEGVGFVVVLRVVRIARILRVLVQIRRVRLADRESSPRMFFLDARGADRSHLVLTYHVRLLHMSNAQRQENEEPAGAGKSSRRTLVFSLASHTMRIRGGRGLHSGTVTLDARSARDVKLHSDDAREVTMLARTHRLVGRGDECKLKLRFKSRDERDFLISVLSSLERTDRRRSRVVHVREAHRSMTKTPVRAARLTRPGAPKISITRGSQEDTAVHARLDRADTGDALLSRADSAASTSGSTTQTGDLAQDAAESGADERKDSAGSADVESATPSTAASDEADDAASEEQEHGDSPSDRGDETRGRFVVPLSRRRSLRVEASEEASVRLSQRRYFHEFSLLVATFNMNLADLPDDLENWLPRNTYDVYAVGLQECSLHDAVSKAILRHLNRDSQTYVLVAERSMGPIRNFVFAHRRVAEHATHVEAYHQSTGFGHVLANKGAAGIAFRLFGRRFCFLACHLAAHQDLVLARNRDAWTILHEMRFGSRFFDVCAQNTVFLYGDLNYRLDTSRERAIALASEGKFGELAKFDQLAKEMRAGRVFTQFNEATISFPPTYKYKVRVMPREYADERQRVPSYTDRILWQRLPDVEVDSLVYESCDNIVTSDHSPIRAGFRVRIPGLPKPSQAFAFAYISLTDTTLRELHRRDVQGTLLDDSLAESRHTRVSVFVPCLDGVLRRPLQAEVVTGGSFPIVLGQFFAQPEFLREQHLLFRVSHKGSRIADGTVGLRSACESAMRGAPISFACELGHGGQVAGYIDGKVQVYFSRDPIFEVPSPGFIARGNTMRALLNRSTTFLRKRRQYSLE